MSHVVVEKLARRGLVPGESRVLVLFARLYGRMLLSWLGRRLFFVVLFSFLLRVLYLQVRD